MLAAALLNKDKPSLKTVRTSMSQQTILISVISGKLSREDLLTLHHLSRYIKIKYWCLQLYENFKCRERVRYVLGLIRFMGDTSLWLLCKFLGSSWPALNWGRMSLLLPVSKRSEMIRVEVNQASKAYIITHKVKADTCRNHTFCFQIGPLNRT